jgi:hypothetical protein
LFFSLLVSVYDHEKELTSTKSFLIQFLSTTDKKELFLADIDAAKEDKNSVTEILGNFTIDDEIEINLYEKDENVDSPEGINHNNGTVSNNHSNEPLNDDPASSSFPLSSTSKGVYFLDRIKIPIICLDRSKPSPLTITTQHGIEIDILFNIIDDSHLTEELLFGNQNASELSDDEDDLEQRSVGEEDDEDEEEDGEKQTVVDRYSLQRRNQKLFGFSHPFVESKDDLEGEGAVVEGEEELEEISNEYMMTSASSFCLDSADERRASLPLKQKQMIWKLSSYKVYLYLKTMISQISTSTVESISLLLSRLSSFTSLLLTSNHLVFLQISDLSSSFLSSVDELITKCLKAMDGLSQELIQEVMGTFSYLLQALWKQIQGIDFKKSTQRITFRITKAALRYGMKQFHPMIRQVVDRSQFVVRITKPVIQSSFVQNTLGNVDHLLTTNSLSCYYYGKMKRSTNALIKDATAMYEEVKVKSHVIKSLKDHGEKSEKGEKGEKEKTPVRERKTLRLFSDKK